MTSGGDRSGAERVSLHGLAARASVLTQVPTGKYSVLASLQTQKPSVLGQNQALTASVLEQGVPQRTSMQACS